MGVNHVMSNLDAQECFGIEESHVMQDWHATHVYFDYAVFISQDAVTFLRHF